MKKIIFTILAVLWVFPQISAQYSVVLIDSMKTGGEFIDNNFLVTPEGYDKPFRGFKVEERAAPEGGLSFPAISQTDTILANIGLTNFFACFDYRFPQEVSRASGDTLMVEFDLMFNLTGGSGEGGRMNITLLPDLPEGGITAENFGTPAYHFWIFNGSYGPNLSYGGEFTDNPGWNGGAGGYYYNENAADPNASTTYTSTDNYPLVPYSKQFGGGPYVSTTKWKHYTLVLAPEMMHLYWRDTGSDPVQNEEIVFMAIPKQEDNIDFINQAHGTFEASMPPAYAWYETINGIRFFNRGATRSEGDNYFYVSNLKITKTGTPVSTYAEFQRPNFRVKEDEGSYNLPLVVLNIPDGEEVTVKVEHLSGDVNHIDNWSEGTVTFNKDGVKALPIPLVNLPKEENDTITLAITEVTGGYYPTTGPNRTFQLVIRPVVSSIGPDNKLIRNLVLVPNPASDYIRIENNLQYGASIELFSISGKQVYETIYKTGDEINISELNPGMYYMISRDSNGTLIGKFMKR